jgi:predicted ATPase
VKLVDRQPERELLEGVLASLRNPVGATIVLAGEPGIGKTSLLDFAAQHAADLTVVRVRGVEPEAEYCYATLYQAISSFLIELRKMPEPQRESLASVFGLGDSPHTATNEFLVGLATITFLSEAAASAPLLVIVDDAQWIDQASLQVLSFVARRLSVANPIGFIFAHRDSDRIRRFLEGLPEVRLTGLPAADARELLATAASGQVNDEVAARIVASQRKNQRPQPRS